MLFRVLGVVLAVNCVVAFEADCSSKFSDLGYSVSTVICPTGCWQQSHSLCGTGTYGNGPVCLAAIHAGVISDWGGVAHVYETTGFNSSRGSLSHAVWSSAYGPEKQGYTFQITCNATGNTEFTITKLICPSNCQSNYVCGSDFHSSNSSVCAAAIHSGIRSAAGGQVRIYRRQGQSSHQGSTNHSITTSTCGSTKILFNFMKIDDCLSSPCQHGGTCIDLIADYGCICPVDYDGKNCEKQIDDCVSSPCQHGGTCDDLIADYVCICPADYDGKNCEKQIYGSCAETTGNAVQQLKSGELVYCSNGWRVFQRRMDGSIPDFHTKTWEQYSMGFGNMSREFWLGLRKLHNITRQGGCRLRVDLQSFDNVRAYAEYSTFAVASEADFFRISIGGYNGTAGDSLDISGSPADQMQFSINGMKFTTVDSDNDNNPSSNCAIDHTAGGWWFNRCFFAAPNAVYGEARQANWWSTFNGTNAMKFTQMGLRCD